MLESHLDHLEPLHVGGTLIDCYLRIIGVSGCHKFWRHIVLYTIVNNQQSCRTAQPRLGCQPLPLHCYHCAAM